MDCFLPDKMILIDASGWGDLLLGVVVGALKPPSRMVMERRISISSFQPPNFENKKYLDDAVKIADEIVDVLKPDSETCFHVSSEYVLSKVIDHLRKQGFKVQKVESTGDLKQLVEDGYVRWGVEKGVPRELLLDKKRFWSFLEWVAQNPNLRESLVKTGWASWERKWQREIYKNKKKELQDELSFTL
jgi:hypothetical protein